MYEYDASLAYTDRWPRPRSSRDSATGSTGVEVKLDDPFDAKDVGRTHRGAASTGPTGSATGWA